MDASFICCCCCSDLLCRNEMQKMGGGDRLSALQSLLQIQLVPMANKGKYGIMSIKRLQRHFASRNDHLSTNLFKYMLTLLELNEDSWFQVFVGPLEGMKENHQLRQKVVLSHFLSISSRTFLSGTPNWFLHKHACIPCLLIRYLYCTVRRVVYDKP